MKFNYYTFWLPLWAYLNQPLFNSASPMVWSPQHFWYRYQLTLLERCWHMSHQEGHPQA
ncbi:hypothetical protein PJF56_16705 [Roseofilum sp. BLCC_M91]|uniref:Uncharacterized protein n=1 Tax=Roseofilum halophilum BLCC-M91 TaxID=3022259 RepID=A0ABT7BMS3_9CYAN|nr:hypothetical protein [Roseofilum halophilum]MDJ1180504.1 hypothetical protein [Roseofilum halophilum BLCC-M91]